MGGKWCHSSSAEWESGCIFIWTMCTFASVCHLSTVALGGKVARANVAHTKDGAEAKKRESQKTQISRIHANGESVVF